MLYDRARIFVQGGGGGNGCLSFRREAHVPRGGPDGGDGGRGGDVVLLCDDSLRDLQSFKRRAHYKAQRGRHGQGALRHGADGEDLVVRVPPGTQATGLDGSRHDLVVPGQRAAAAAAAATRRLRRRPIARRAASSPASPVKRGVCICGSSCWPTSAWSGGPTRASRPCWRA